MLQITTAPSTPQRSDGPFTTRPIQQGEPQRAPTRDHRGDLTGLAADEVRLVVEHGMVVNIAGPAAARLGYDPINTDASTLLDAASSGEPGSAWT